MSTPTPIYIDATMILRWQHLAPVGIVRLERLLAAHLRFGSQLDPAQYVVWDAGYRPAEDYEVASLDRLLRDSETQAQPRASETSLPVATVSSGRKLPTARRTAMRAVGRLPDHLRPFAEQAAWSLATFGIESARYSRRAWTDRRTRPGARGSTHGVNHRAAFPPGTDLVALGLGWEYLDHEAMYRLKHERGVRIHMPAFDLIPVLMPQMNAGQSHLVHRYYAEMAHYADSITSISEATKSAIERFFAAESLPVPHLAVNPLPGMSAVPSVEEGSTPHGRPRHRFVGANYVLTVSTIEIRKNHLLLAKIWAECIGEGIDMPKIVLVGRFGWDVDELRRWINYAPELDGMFIVCTDVDDDELAALYQDALFTVFPSRIEGWGLPITEALSYGKVCLHSTDPAQFEASQGLMPALHPDDFLGWKAEVLRLCSDETYRSSLEAVITERYVPRTVTEYCEHFEAILASRRSTGAAS
jgi:glycosyltransferase involved in cell wall biosynthesis